MNSFLQHPLGALAEGTWLKKKLKYCCTPFLYLAIFERVVVPAHQHVSLFTIFGGHAPLKSTLSLRRTKFGTTRLLCLVTVITDSSAIDGFVPAVWGGNNSKKHKALKAINRKGFRC